MSLAATYFLSMLIAGTWDGDVKKWDVSTWNFLESWKAHRGPVVALALSPDDASLITGSVDQTVKIWDTKAKEVRRTIRGHADVIWSPDLSPDGQTLATASWDGAVKLWSRHRSQEFDVIEALGYSMDFSPDSERLALAGFEVKLFDVRGLDLRGQLQGYCLPFRDAEV
jgi:WD40 repeat protein